MGLYCRCLLLLLLIMIIITISILTVCRHVGSNNTFPLVCHGQAFVTGLYASLAGAELVALFYWADVGQ